MNVYCDTNFYYHIMPGNTTSPYDPDTVREFMTLVGNDKVKVFATPVNVIEIGSHLETDFCKQQELFKELDRITGSNMLLSPQGIVAKDFGQESDNSDTLYRRIKDEIIKAKNISDLILLDLICEIRNLHDVSVDWALQLLSAKSKAKKNKGNVFVKNEDIRSIFENHFRTFRFSKGLHDREFFAKGTMQLYGELIRGYIRKMCMENKKPKRQDFDDLENSIYMPYMDYYIFFDSKFKKVIKSSGICNYKFGTLKDFLMEYRGVL